MQKQVTFKIVSSKANGELHQALLPNKEKEIAISQDVKLRPSGMLLMASVGDAEIWQWAIEFTSGIVSSLVVAAFLNVIWPKISANPRVTAIVIGKRRISKKQKAIEKAFLEEIVRLEEQEKEPRRGEGQQ